jgi:NADPH:quinone reductase-like Zn-dependent oxidoreductase
MTTTTSGTHHADGPDRLDPEGRGRTPQGVPIVMSAVRVHTFGDPSAARLEHDVPVPIPGPDEVQVRVLAAGVNPLDWKVREGYLRDFVPHQLPLVLGWDLAGTVTQVGADVTGFALGDHVLGRPSTLRGGAFAQYAVLPAHELGPMPVGLDHRDAAALPLAATTAVQAFELADLQAGQHVLVHAAAGGVGHLAVQLARHLGARVVATALPQDAAFVRDTLGVPDVVIPSPIATEELQAAAPGGYDMVLDLLGGATYAASLDLLRPGGIVVTTVAFPDPDDLRRRGVRAVFLDNDADTARLATVARLAAEGHLRPHVTAVLPLHRATEAFTRSQAGQVRGKLVLDTTGTTSPAGSRS